MERTTQPYLAGQSRQGSPGGNRLQRRRLHEKGSMGHPKLTEEQQAEVAARVEAMAQRAELRLPLK